MCGFRTEKVEPVTGATVQTGRTCECYRVKWGTKIGLPPWVCIFSAGIPRYGHQDTTVTSYLRHNILIGYLLGHITLRWNTLVSICPA